MSVTTSKRPSLEKRQSRTERTAETNKVDASLDLGIKFTIDGEDFSITMGDLTAWDVRDLRQQTGYSFAQLLDAFWGDGTDVDIVAACLWLARKVNGGETSLTYEQVARETGYEVIDKIRQGSQPADDVDEDKEAGDLDPEG